MTDREGDETILLLSAVVCGDRLPFPLGNRPFLLGRAKRKKKENMAETGIEWSCKEQRLVFGKTWSRETTSLRH